MTNVLDLKLCATLISPMYVILFRSIIKAKVNCQVSFLAVMSFEIKV